MNSAALPLRSLVLAMALFLAIGAPIVLFDWWTLDKVLAGYFPVKAMIAATLLAVVFLGSAVILGRYIRRATSLRV